MARPRTYRSLHWNPLLADKDELAGTAPEAFTNDSDTSSHTPAVLRGATPALAMPLTPAELVAKYTDANL